MATKKEIDKHLKLALKEIGKIDPWFDEEFQDWTFSHPLYPAVEYGGKTKAEVIRNYPKHLREFILHRLDDRIEKRVEKQTKGRGGKRPGAGRPKGTRKAGATKVVRLDTRITDWLDWQQDNVFAIIAETEAKRFKRH